MARATLNADSAATRPKLAKVCRSEYMSSARTPARFRTFQMSRRTFDGFIACPVRVAKIIAAGLWRSLRRTRSGPALLPTLELLSQRASGLEKASN